MISPIIPGNEIPGTAPMRICSVIDTLQFGGAETLLLGMIEHSELTHTVCYRKGQGKRDKAFQKAGATVRDLGFTWQYDPVGIGRLVTLCHEQEFDVIHGHLPASIVAARLAGWLTGIPVVATHHNVPDNYRRISRALERLTRGLDAETVGCSAGVTKAHGGDLITIQNGIDIQGYAATVEAADLNSIDDVPVDAEPVLLNVARYVPQKRQSDLVAAMPHVRESFPDAHLVLVGHGSCEAAIHQAVKDHGVEENVSITGTVPKVEPYYALADIFVSASEFEGLPITFLEAMAASLPVVATDISGVDEVVVDRETGRLVPVGDVQSLIKAITEMDRATRERLGRAGYQRAEEKFDIRRTAAEYVALYERVITD